MRTVAGILLIGAVIFGGVFTWASFGELLRSTQDVSASLRHLGGTLTVPAPSPATTAVPSTATPSASAEAHPAGPGPAATVPLATEPPSTPPVLASTALTATPGPAPPAAPTQASPVPTPAGRSPWVLLPGPEPGSRLSSGPAVIEARGRGDAPIREIRLELDGRSLPVALEQRSESIWLAHASVDLPPGPHQARAVVVDAEGRSGAYRWSFEALR